MTQQSTPTPTAENARPRAIRTIAIIILITTFRASQMFELSSLEMFGGVQSDGWLVPWVTDSVLGVLAPLMAYLAFRRKGLVVWGVLVAYNCLGAYDYGTGLVTQWLHPQVGFPVAAIYIFIGVFMSLQLFVIGLLFRKDVRDYFTVG